MYWLRAFAFRKFYLALLLFIFSAVFANSLPITPPAAAIASATPYATQAGFKILKEGGNAFDAAVAIAAVLAVTEPYSTGLGGGCFFLLHIAKNNLDIVIDGRERAPLRAHRDMYLKSNGQVDKQASLNGPRAAAIPGEPAALAYLVEHYGKLTLKQDLQPAIELAEKGFTVDAYYGKRVKTRLDILRKYPTTAIIFLNHDQIPFAGFKLVQTDLAETFKQIAEKGWRGFYEGEVAHRLVKSVTDDGGIWQRQDLQMYHVKIEPPLVLKYGETKVVTVPPPSAGGVALLEMLNILSQFDLERMTELTRKQVIIEAMRRAYFDRARFLDDPEFVTVPIHFLISSDHAKHWYQSIELNHATPSVALGKVAEIKQGLDTTHFSILDKEGNRVAATLTINYNFGSGFVAQGTGVLLNDEMDDFAAASNSNNVYGLISLNRNLIAPLKRPLSSMTPTFIEGPRSIAILGTPGGSRIISMVLLGVLDYLAGHKPDSWVGLMRYHQQYLPDVVEYEKGAFTEQEIKALTQMGYHLKAVSDPYGNMQAILWDVKNNQVYAASDPRRQGLAEIQ